MSYVYNMPNSVVRNTVGLQRVSNVSGVNLCLHVNFSSRAKSVKHIGAAETFQDIKTKQ